jgi:Rps23 Pro-64 3,4-dihydroxylase Tpa1-like proline 4-hydroxylase
MIDHDAIGSLRDAYTESFRTDGRIRIRNFLQHDAATALRKTIDALDWRLVLNEGERHFDIQPNQLAHMTGSQRRSLRLAAAERAKSQFQYFYENYPVHDIYHAKGRDALPAEIAGVYEALNSEDTLALLRDITQQPVDFCDAQITRFRTGALLNEHDDNVSGKNRLFAYTLSLADPWKESWGGTLSFLDARGDVIERFVPSFNTLAIFSVPTLHRVDPVNDKARGERISVTGWFRSGQPEELA